MNTRRHRLLKRLNKEKKRLLAQEAIANTSKLKIMEEFETIRLIIEKKCSLSRFGDGEFRVANGSSCSSQMRDVNLAGKMLEILKNKTPGLLVGILDPKRPERWGRYYVKPMISEVMDFDSQYVSMGVTRTDQAPHIYCEEYWDLCKQIWEDRDIVIVYGGKRIGEHMHKFKPRTQEDLIRYAHSRNFEVRIEDEQKVNLKALSVDKYGDAFNNTRSINYVKGYHICASLGYKELIRDISQYPKSSLIYMALGSTATALARDLHLMGYQAIDFGHWGRYYKRFKEGNTKL